jgi:hypothetical protein
MKRFGTLAAGAALAACGPSFQAIYEGNSRFEHCYALEENPQTPARERADCWRDWSERYTYGQTRDRVQYAIARYVALSQAANVPTDEALMMAAPGVTPRQTTITAPAPTNAFAPPPKVLDDIDAGLRPATGPDRNKVVGEGADAGPAASAAKGPPPPLPSAECTDRCGSAYKDCGLTCDAGAKCADQCNKPYKTCMRGCFK